MDGSEETLSASASNETNMSDLKGLMMQINTNIMSSEKKLSKRIDALEADLEGKLYKRIHELITTTVRSEIDELRRVYMSEVEGLKSQIALLEKSYAEAVKANGSFSVSGESKAQFEERKRRIVVRNLPSGPNETSQVVLDKVNAMIRDGCKLTDVKVTTAERKATSGKNPGVVIASIETFPQKQTLMKNKFALKRTTKYKNIYIENDYSSDTK